MDAREAFKKLGFGARFDYKRFRSDAVRLKLVKNDAIPPPSSRRIANFENQDFIDTELLTTPTKNQEKTNTNTELQKNDEAAKQTPLRLFTNMVAEENIDNFSVKKSKRGRKKKKKSAALVQEQRRREEVAHFRKQNKIYAWGSDIPDPSPSFETVIRKYRISESFAETMRQLLGDWKPTPIQAQAIPVMLERREILGSAPTGSGKTLAFLIPLLHHLQKPSRGGFRAVIVEPTRELAIQVYKEAVRFGEGLGLRVHMITDAKVAQEKFGPSSKKQFDILVSTPNRLAFLLKEDPPALELSTVEWLIIDESDKLFEGGKRGFRDQLAVIYQACNGAICRRALFSATFSYDVEKWCKANLDNMVMISIGARNSAVETVKQELIFAGTEHGKLIGLRQLITQGIAPPVLIFVQTKVRAEQLFGELMYDGINADVLHSGRTRQERENIVKRFRCGQIWFLICTELMARGVDFKSVSVVINYDFPPSAISYIHRIGRTGRAGREGRAITFYTEQDRALLRSVANVMKAAGYQPPPEVMEYKKPSRKLQRRLAHRAIQRKDITTIPRKERKRKLKQPKHKAKKERSENGVQKIQ